MTNSPLLGITGNPNNLLTEEKLLHQNQRWGHRALYFRAYRCPNGRCAACEWNRNDKVGDVGYHYKEPPIKSYSYKMTHNADNKSIKELFEHMYRLTPVQLILEDCNKNKTTYTEGSIFTTNDREIIWDKNAPIQKGQTYQVNYDAYEEIFAHVIHVSGGAFGVPTQAEKGTAQPYGGLSMGELAISIPYESQAYHAKTGDLFVFVDSEMTFDTVIDLEAPQKYTKHKYVTYLEHAFTLQEDKDNKDATLVEIKEFSLENITWNKETRSFEYKESELLPYSQNITVTYRARPQYTVYLDAGEFRTPLQGKMPRMVLLTRSELG